MISTSHEIKNVLQKKKKNQRQVLQAMIFKTGPNANQTTQDSRSGRQHRTILQINSILSTVFLKGKVT